MKNQKQKKLFGIETQNNGKKTAGQRWQMKSKRNPSYVMLNEYLDIFCCSKWNKRFMKHNLTASSLSSWQYSIYASFRYSPWSMKSDRLESTFTSFDSFQNEKKMRKNAWKLKFETGKRFSSLDIHGNCYLSKL